MTNEELKNNLATLGNAANKAGLFDLNESMAVGQTIIEITVKLDELENLKTKENENKGN